MALLLAHLGEFDQRRLHSDRGQPSLFSYCVNILGYSEQAAYKRIQAARAARAHPEILRSLEAGELTLTAVVILSPHLGAADAREILAEARGRRTREVEALAARLAPRPDSPDCLRALPAPSSWTAEDAMRDRIEPLSPRRYLFRITGSAEFFAKYQRAKELLSAARSERSIEGVVDAALDTLLDKRDPARRIARREARAERVRGENVSAGSALGSNSP